MKPDSNRLMAIDMAVIVIVSVAICLASKELFFMTILVPTVILLRIALIISFAKREGVNMKAEILFFIICIALGAFNDWNSVCNKKIYQYTVPHYFDFSTIPLWMLLFWGMILRFIARLARWQALGPDTEISNVIGLGGRRIDNGTIKVIFELLLVLLTRNTIYRFYSDPILSWLPFLTGLVVFLLLFKPGKHDIVLLGIFLVGGPLIEILYIQLGELHYYALGWIGGVPLWILMWWLVIILIWKDLAFRIEKILRVNL